MNIEKNETFKLTLVEFFGTMFLMLLGAGPLIIGDDNIFTLYFSFPIALAIVSMLLVNTAKAQVNPASSIGLCINEKISLKHMFLSIISQIIGAIVGAAILYGVFQAKIKYLNLSPDTLFPVAGNPVANGDYKNGLGLMFAGLAITFLASFIFVYGTLHVVNNKRLAKFGFLLIPFVFLASNALTTAVAGTNANFAIKIGSAIFNAKEVFKTIWVPLVGNILGAIVAGYLGNLILKAKKPHFECCEGDDCDCE